MRKFLEMEDEVLAIYDEIRDQPGSKQDNRFNDEPVKLHKGEDGEEEQETIEIVSAGLPGDGSKLNEKAAKKDWVI